MSWLYGWQDEAQKLSLLLNPPEAVGSVHQQPVLRPVERLLDEEEKHKDFKKNNGDITYCLENKYYVIILYILYNTN